MHSRKKTKATRPEFFRKKVGCSRQCKIELYTALACTTFVNKASAKVTNCFGQCKGNTTNQHLSASEKCVR